MINNKLEIIWLGGNSLKYGNNDEFYGVKQNRIIWDISVIAYLINNEWFETKAIKGLRLSEELQYYTDLSKTSKTMVEQLDSKKIYDNLFKVLK